MYTYYAYLLVILWVHYFVWLVKGTSRKCITARFPSMTILFVTDNRINTVLVDRAPGLWFVNTFAFNIEYQPPAPRVRIIFITYDAA